MLCKIAYVCIGPSLFIYVTSFLATEQLCVLVCVLCSVTSVSGESPSRTVIKSSCDFVCYSLLKEIGKGFTVRAILLGEYREGLAPLIARLGLLLSGGFRYLR